MAKNVPIGTGGGGQAAAPTQQPFVMKENKTNTDSKGVIHTGVAPSGIRASGKGCC
jgi:hypothetical protein